jgi:hypothetical protein
MEKYDAYFKKTFVKEICKQKKEIMKVIIRMTKA